MRILIVHNLLWAHYKSVVFEALQRQVDSRPDMELNVVQIARNERSRAGLETDAGAPVYAYTYTRALLRHARAFRPDVINLTGYYDPAGWLLLLWAKAQGIRVVMQNESTAADGAGATGLGWKNRFKQVIFGQCDGFFCFGTQSANYLIALGVPPAKILLRKNAVDNTTLQAAYERALPGRAEQQRALGLRPNNFVFVGRLIGVKNLPTLVSAFAEAQAQSPRAVDWGLLLLGDGAEAEALRAQTKTLNLGDAVRFLPGRPWYRVPEVLALGNVLVLPSQSEPWGLVVNEAMACGLPVIVSDRCGCVPDLVDAGQTGLVFDPDQPAQLTDRLLQFMNGAVDTAAMGQAARQRIKPYAPEAVAGEMLDGFMNVVA